MSNTLHKLLNIYLKNKRYFSDFIWGDLYSDEPQAYIFNLCVLNLKKYSDGYYKKNDPHSTGASLEIDKALIKVIAEILERFACYCYREKELTTATHLELKESVDPQLFSLFSEELKKEYPRFKIKNTSKLSWKKGNRLDNDKNVYLPAQLIYINYRYKKNEPIIQYPSSNGSAGGFSKKEAIYKGIMEQIEREAVLIYFLNKLKPKHIILNTIKNSKFKKLYQQVKKYNLELSILDIATDLTIPIYLAIITDPTKIGVPISIGSKADLSNEKALVGAVEEAIQTRSWLRKVYETNKKKYKVGNKFDIQKILDRGMYWYNYDLLDTLDFFLNTEGKAFIDSGFKEEEIDNKYLKIKEILIKNNIDMYYVDVTPSDIRKFNFFVIKTLSPQIMPLYFDEKYPYFNCRRLYDVPVRLDYHNKIKQESELNQVPHPIL